MKSPFRVKPYAHRDYKFVVRAKVNGQWKRRYFRTEQEAESFATEQNELAAATTPTKVSQPAGRRPTHVSSPALAWTGERLVPTSPRPVAYEHLHRYAIACALAPGLRVLDIACGEGYGANLLAEHAVDVIAIDIDAGTIAHAAAEYRRPNLRFIEGDCLSIPLPDGSVDLVASFETIEHLREHDRFLAEIRRVLTPEGVLIISSPDQVEYNRVSTEVNPFHLAELTHDAFERLLKSRFQNVVTGKQRLVFGSWIAPDDAPPEVASATADGWFDGVTVERGVHHGVYSIAVCSDAPLPPISFGIFEKFQETAETWDLLNRHGTAADIAMRLASAPGETKAEEAKSVRLRWLKQRNAALAQEIGALRAQATDNAALKANLARVSELLDAARERQRQLEADLARAVVESADATRAHWEVLTLRSDLLRGKDGAADATARLSVSEDRANAATAQRDQLREMLLAMEKDLEQERLNVAALVHRLRVVEESSDAAQRRDHDETAAPAADSVDAELRDLQQRLYAAEDRATAAEAAARTTEQRAAASEDQVRTILAQWEATQGQLRTTTKELAARRAQISRLREQLARRLILPFGEMQRRIDELTRA